LGNSRKTAVLNLLSVELQRVFWKLETFLDESSKFTDAAAFLSKDFLCMGSTDDNLRSDSEII